MGKRRRAKITLCLGLVEYRGRLYYEVLLNDDTHFSFPAATVKRPHTGDLLEWIMESGRCDSITVNGRPIKTSDESLQVAQKLWKAQTTFGEWILTNSEQESTEILRGKFQILVAVAIHCVDAAWVTTCRIPEPLIDALTEFQGQPSTLEPAIMSAWAEYLRLIAHSEEDKR